MRQGVNLATEISVGTFVSADLVLTSNCTLIGGVKEKGAMWQGHALTYRWEICFRSLGSSKGQTQRSEMETPLQGVRVISMRRAPRQLSRGSSKQLSCLSGRAEISTLHLGTFQGMGKAGIIPRPSQNSRDPISHKLPYYQTSLSGHELLIGEACQSPLAQGTL